MRKNEIETAVRSLAEKAAEENGLTVWDVRFEKEGKDYFLRVFIDKPDGRVAIDDCVAVSQALDEPLDGLELFDAPYSLQVSSPGIERRLTRPEHYEWAVGRKVMLKLRGRGVCKGVLRDYSRDGVTLSFDTGDEFFAPNETIWVKADDFDDETE
ncbi:MAG: ribosome maturation factor RimP [Clostridia bacterium]|nr:ribosome maturation factor RimP [Clostridia bacterium]